jgi:hypothetical protein
MFMHQLSILGWANFRAQRLASKKESLSEEQTLELPPHEIYASACQSTRARC